MIVFFYLAKVLIDELISRIVNTYFFSIKIGCYVSIFIFGYLIYEFWGIFFF